MMQLVSELSLKSPLHNAIIEIVLRALTGLLFHKFNFFMYWPRILCLICSGQAFQQSSTDWQTCWSETSVNIFKPRPSNIEDDRRSQIPVYLITRTTRAQQYFCTTQYTSIDRAVVCKDTVLSRHLSKQYRARCVTVRRYNNSNFPNPAPCSAGS